MEAYVSEGKVVTSGNKVVVLYKDENMINIVPLTQTQYEAASAAGTLDEGKWYGVYPDA